MLTFEQKLEIIESFPELTRKDVSMKRVNFHFEESLYDKKTVVYHLHPNGNGFVYVGDLPHYEADDKGFVNIREFNEKELRSIIADALDYLSLEPEPPYEKTWTNRENVKLLLAYEEPFWNIYTGKNLEESFGTFDDAKEYLLDQGFREKN
ncbi:hypothetical protein B0H99_105239 [Planomicrobium soli]|uniref:Uncharacterized protein n=1 Tax=Planomicrobium soli TaxID=1176648 RepID=A0A2P8H2M7_9BACL|nr:hypothetical protein [Planomicrobium soli]PSL40461.1 hypothetical protein B0H99_105239 [Planomicrobium soli]